MKGESGPLNRIMLIPPSPGGVDTAHIVSTISAGVSTEASLLGTGFTAIAAIGFACRRDDDLLDVPFAFALRRYAFIMFKKGMDYATFIRV